MVGQANQLSQLSIAVEVDTYQSKSDSWDFKWKFMNKSKMWSGSWRVIIDRLAVEDDLLSHHVKKSKGQIIRSKSRKIKLTISKSKSIKIVD